MATYEETILADVPALYYRLDMVGGAANGDPIPDLSGNALHGELVFTGAANEPYGFATAIETDGSSRAFFGNNDPFVGVARIQRDSDPLIEPAGDFTLEGWLRLPPTVPGASHAPQPYFGKPGNPFLPTTNSFYLGTDLLGNQFVGVVYDSAGTAWTVADSTTGGGGSLLNNVFYHLVLVRLGNTLAIYTNGTLRGTTTITSSLATNVNGGFFYVHTDQTAPMAAVYDEVALYTHALTSTQILAHYNAAINASLLSGASNVIPSSILYSDIEPEPVSFPFRHNWDDALIERVSFLTSRSTATKGYESGNQQRPKPRREIEISQVLRDNDERQAFRAKLTAQQHAKWFIPILEDREQLTTTLAAGSTLMPADTQYRDYEIGSYMELRQLSATGTVTKAEHALITSLSPLTTTAIVNTYDAYLSTIGPARRGIVEAQVSLRGHTDAVEDLPLVIRLLAEDEAVVPNRITPWTPTLTYHGYEVFDPAVWQSNDWSELRDYGVERQRADIDFDTGIFSVESDTVAASESFSYRMLLETRAQHAALLGWFYARAGAWSYLWAPTMQRDFNVVSVASNNLTVAAHNYFDNYAGSEFRRDLSFVYNDNAMVLRRISSVVLSGANEVLTLDAVVPTLTNLRSVSYLRFCRMDGDTLEIARATDTKARFAWGFREMLSSPE